MEPAIPYLDEALVKLNFLLSEYPDKKVLEIHRSHLENTRKLLMDHRRALDLTGTINDGWYLFGKIPLLVRRIVKW